MDEVKWRAENPKREIRALGADLEACQIDRELDARSHRICEAELTRERDEAIERLEIIHPVALMLAREKDEFEKLVEAASRVNSYLAVMEITTDFKMPDELADRVKDLEDAIGVYDGDTRKALGVE